MNRPCLIAGLLGCMMQPVAHAHDANLARWDLAADGDNLTIQLRTAGKGLHASLAAAAPDTDWQALDVAAYDGRLQAFLADTVRLTEGGAPLRLDSVQPVRGHEASVLLRFSRPHAGPLAPLTLDLDAYTDRPNQHHLVFIDNGEARERVMLQPGSGYALCWPDRDCKPRKAAGGWGLVLGLIGAFFFGLRAVVPSPSAQERS